MKFNKIVLVDNTGLRDWAIAKIKGYAKEVVADYDDYPTNESIIIDRIGNADAMLVSWNTVISENVIKQCPNLKYIGMCCSLYDESSANVHVKYAKANAIEVRGVRDYGDEGLIEYIISELIQLIKGLGPHQWKAEPVELTNRKLGIIGMGTTGEMLAERAKAFQMDVHYYSRNRKLEAENKGVKYLPLAELLSTCEVVSIHLPKNTQVLNRELFDAFGDGKILINTSLGLTFEKDSFLNWIQGKRNFAIMDGDGVGNAKKEFQKYPQIIMSKKVGGWTFEAKNRLSEKVVENIKDYTEIMTN